MLWMKSWLETRSRFLISLTAATGLCASAVFHWNRNGLPDSRIDYFRVGLFSGHILLCVLWITAVTLLMMGGLLREKSNGAASLTLALPVSKRRVLIVRTAVGFLQSIALVIVPWCVMLAVGRLTGKTDPLSVLWFMPTLLLTGGMLFLGFAVLISSLVEGEYTAPSAALVLAIGLEIALDGRKPYNPWAFITGEDYVQRGKLMMIPPFPWLHAAILVGIGLLLIAASVFIMERRDF